MSRPRVFAVQEDPRKNLLPALDYGEIEYVLEVGDVVSMNSGPWIRKIRDAMRSFGSDDFVLAVGDPIAIGIACVHASSANGGRFKMLKWDRQERRYFPITIDMDGT